MATKKYSNENYISNQMGIPGYDYIENTYDVDNNLINTKYYRGGSAGELVAEIEMTYDDNNNLLTVERVA